MSKVLVTGGSGFLASHCLVQLLDAGHTVRTTLRDLARIEEVRAAVRAGGADPDRLSFVRADLSADAGWSEATSDCDYVLHVASPFPADAPKDENELIGPARDGTLRVLRAARESGVGRVVMTSSFAAVGYGHRPRSEVFTESEWTDVSGPDVQPYIKSKTLAERAAWDFVADGGLDLTVINPVGIFGPVLSPHVPGSVHLIKRMLDGGMPATPRLWFGVVDVRDVAALHLAAMTAVIARGERFIAVAGEPVSLQEVARELRVQFGERARVVPRRQLPDLLVRLLALRSPAMRQMVPQLGVVRRASSEKAQRMLGWRPRQNTDVVHATAEALFRLGLSGAS